METIEGINLTLEEVQKLPDSVKRDLAISIFRRYFLLSHKRCLDILKGLGLSQFIDFENAEHYFDNFIGNGNKDIKTQGK